VRVDADCQSQVCTLQRCAAPACQRREKNGAETDVDCGGSGTCMRCAVGKACRVDRLRGHVLPGQLLCSTPACSDG